jgi:drug/metabolite transporter (DMT)-like permease
VSRPTGPRQPLTGSTLGLLLVLACLWGASFLFIKVALDGLSPMQITMGRLTAGAVVLVSMVAIRRTPLPRELPIWGHLAFMGVVANIVPFFLFAWGEERITSGLAGVLNGSTPLFTLGFAIAALPEERLGRGRAAGLLLGFLGVVLVVGPWDQNPLTSSVPGQLACLGAAACYGFTFVYTRRHLSGRGHPVLALSAGQLATATAIAWLLSPLLGRGEMTLTVTVVASILTLGAFGTGFAYLLYYRLIERAGATTASMVTYLIPIVAVVLGVLVLDEPVGWNLFVGAAVVIAGVAVAEGRVPWLPRRPVPVPESGTATSDGGTTPG